MGEMFYLLFNIQGRCLVLQIYLDYTTNIFTILILHYLITSIMTSEMYESVTFSATAPGYNVYKITW